jgi:outer membrane protein
VKNLSIVLNVVLFIAVGVLYYLHFSGAPAKTAVENAAADSTEQNNESVAQQIVYVNTDSLLENYESFKSNKATLEAKSRKAESDLATRTRNLENEFLSAQQKAQAGALTQEQGMKLEQQLMQKQQDLVQYRDNVARKLMEEEQKFNQELNDDIYEFLKTYGKDKGYKFVLGYTRGNSSMLYGGEGLDVTSEILQGLNTKYQEKTQVTTQTKK